MLQLYIAQGDNLATGGSASEVEQNNCNYCGFNFPIQLIHYGNNSIEYYIHAIKSGVDGFESSIESQLIPVSASTPPIAIVGRNTLFISTRTCSLLKRKGSAFE
jgi:hypothetical protein